MPITYKNGNAVSALIGKKIQTKHYGEFEILSESTKSKVVVKFHKTGYTVEVYKGNALKGEVKDKLLPVVCGVGFIGEGNYNSSHISYPYWLSMLKRTYTKLKDGANKSYLDSNTKVCGEWHNFQNFAKWFENYVETNNIDLNATHINIDKDILGADNPLYSPKTCTIVPREINQFFKDISNAVGYGSNKHKTKPFTVKVAGRWLKDFSCEAEAKSFYGERKYQDFLRMLTTTKIPAEVLESFNKLFSEKYGVKI